MSDKLRQLQNLSDKENLTKIADSNNLSNYKTAQIKKLQLCHSHAHGKVV